MVRKVFDPQRRLVAAVGQQAVIAHADTEAAGNAIEHDRTASAFQENMKSAAMAPTWNKIMKEVVVQFRGCFKSAVVLGQGSYSRDPWSGFVLDHDYERSMGRNGAL